MYKYIYTTANSRYRVLGWRPLLTLEKITMEARLTRRFIFYLLLKFLCFGLLFRARVFRFNGSTSLCFLHALVCVLQFFEEEVLAALKSRSTLSADVILSFLWRDCASVHFISLYNLVLQKSSFAVL